jgi:hypothetical protein
MIYFSPGSLPEVQSLPVQKVQPYLLQNLHGGQVQLLELLFIQELEGREGITELAKRKF